MNKTSIKVIKRKDVKVMANVGTRSGREPKQTAPVSEEKIERRSRREIVGTISNWISERREDKHIEEIAGFRKIFGSESLLSKI